MFDEITRLLLSRSSINALIGAADGFDEFMAALTQLLEEGSPAAPTER